MLFSDPVFAGGTVVVVLKDGSETVKPAGEVRWQDYNGKRLGVLTGPLMEDAAAALICRPAGRPAPRAACGQADGPARA